MKKELYHKSLLGILMVFWLFIAINPTDRGVWFAENILFLIFLPILVFTYKKFQFSSLSYTLMFIFLILQTIGSKYGYSNVPFIFDSVRNHYDRVVHFLFGVVFYLPLYELVTKKLKLKGIWSHFFVFTILFSMKGIYEILEWGYVMVTQGSSGSIAFLGAQGDAWDAQKDMFLGGIGAIITGVVMWFKNI